MRKVLIISPHFPPVNAPDMQRVRLALPFLRSLGWEPTVLAIDIASIEGGVRDDWLLKTYPSDVRVIRVKGLAPRYTRWAGIGSVWLRCGPAMTAAGEALLKTEHFDLAFFSTTQFGFFRLATRWKQRFGLPYVLDYQDPWLNRYYSQTGTPPPGGWLKFAFSQWEARRIEPKTLRDASGIIAVSDSYGRVLCESYPWFDPKCVKLLPFGASLKDFEALEGYRPRNPLIDFEDGRRHMVYTGRCGPDMRIAMTTLFRAFKLYQNLDLEGARKIRFHFIGTDYAPPPLGRDWAVPIAKSEGVEDFVSEHCYRVPYFDALYYLKNACALVAVGSNDPTYSPSKFYPYILAQRPMLMIFHDNSPVMEFAKRVSSGFQFGFSNDVDIERMARQVCTEWFAGRGFAKPASFDENAFGEFTAARMTAGLVHVFEKAITAKETNQHLSTSA